MAQSSEQPWKVRKPELIIQWGSSNVKCSLGSGRVPEGEEKEGSLVGSMRQSVAGEASQRVWLALWCGCRAERKWLSQPAITAAVVVLSPTAQHWQRIREAGWPQPLAQVGTDSHAPKFWIPGNCSWQMNTPMCLYPHQDTEHFHHPNISLMPLPGQCPCIYSSTHNTKQLLILFLSSAD